jgi:hypothetical protein
MLCCECWTASACTLIDRCARLPCFQHDVMSFGQFTGYHEAACLGLLGIDLLTRLKGPLLPCCRRPLNGPGTAAYSGQFGITPASQLYPLAACCSAHTSTA